MTVVRTREIRETPPCQAPALPILWLPQEENELAFDKPEIAQRVCLSSVSVFCSGGQSWGRLP